MARPLRIEFPGAYYHVTSRGNEQKNVFRDQKDRWKFLDYLNSSVVRYGAVIHAWCLMSNHYHLLIETPAGNLSQIMRHINGAYTTYFNIKWKRVGHLFQGRYKAILVDADNYMLELSRYIHLNPVRAGIVARPEQYQWSSYKSYIGQNKVSDWQTTDFILGYFSVIPPANSKQEYQKFVEDMLDKEYSSPLRVTTASTILGSEEFVQKVSNKYLRAKDTDRNIPALKVLTPRLSIDEITRIINMALGENGDLTRKISIFFCHKYSGAKLKEIGEHFGISDASVSQTSRRLAVKAEEDKQIKEMISKMEARLRDVRC